MTVTLGDGKKKSLFKQWDPLKERTFLHKGKLPYSASQRKGWVMVLD